MKNELPEDDVHSADAQKDDGYVMDCSDTEREWRESHPEGDLINGEGEEERKNEEPTPQRMYAYRSFLLRTNLTRPVVVNFAQRRRIYQNFMR